ncbi:hypothetical protein [Enterobacter hormaechei]|uniref:hypothetical protein n=1 Tax=Enterobacter hormaechei TaxID=158836 RepID=UPI003D6E1C95
MYLFKFIESQYLDAFFTNGSLRIGTIYDFKDTIEHTSARGDLNEGKHTIFRAVTHELKLSSTENEPIINEFLKLEDSWGTIQNSIFVTERRSEDSFIFCTSRNYSHTIFNEWYVDSDKNNACYAIINPRKFFKEITLRIQDSVTEYINQDVVYTLDPIPYNSKEAKLSPAITKEIKKYSWQTENRTIWRPKLSPVKLIPFVVNVPEAIKYCMPLSYIEKGKIKYYKC